MKNCIENIRIMLWKRKAIERRALHKALQKRFKELEESRDGWKEKAVEYKLAMKDLEKEAKSLKQELSKKNISQ